MTFSELLQKSIRRFWIPLLFVVIVVVITFGFFNRTSYVSTITVGMPTRSNNFSFNLNYDTVNTEKNAANDVSINSLQTVLDTSGYLTRRYSSPETQITILSQMGIPTNNVARETPAYEISSQGLGYINLTYKGYDRDQVNSFIGAVNLAHKNIVDQWNTGRSDDLQVQFSNSNAAVTYEVSPNIQSLLIPVIAAAVFGTLLILIWPYKTKKS